MIAGAAGRIAARDCVVHWLVRVCSWCGEGIDPTSRQVIHQQLQPREVTHGICKGCEAKHFPEEAA